MAPVTRSSRLSKVSGRDDDDARRASDAEDRPAWLDVGRSAWARVFGAPAIEDQIEPEDETSDASRALTRLLTSVARAAMVGGTLKGGLNAFALLARARKKGFTAAATRDALRDTAAFASFLSTFALVYVSADEGLAVAYGKQQSKRWRAAAAGALAGPSLLLADGVGRGGSGSARRHYGLATYIWLRSLVLLVRCGLNRRKDDETPMDPRVERLLAPFASPHADVGLMMASATVILSCFILKPDALRGPYAGFLNRHGGKSVHRYRAVQAVAVARPGAETAAALTDAAKTLYPKNDRAARALLEHAAMNNTHPESRAFDAAVRARPQLWGALLHPGQSPIEHFARFFVSSLARSVTIYFPLYLLPAVLVHRKKLLGPRGKTLAWRAAGGVARSSAFLSAYCASAWLGPDLVQRVVGDMRWWTIVGGVPLAGLATFIEKPSRRQELGIYCASRAVEAGTLCLLDWGMIPRSVSGWRHDVSLFALAAAVIMHCYNAEREVFKSKYLNVLDLVFGNVGHTRQSISHVGSFKDLMTKKPVIGSPPRKVRKKRLNGSGENGEAPSRWYE